jgi:hypothetical protein
MVEGFVGHCTKALREDAGEVNTEDHAQTWSNISRDLLIIPSSRSISPTPCLFLISLLTNISLHIQYPPSTWHKRPYQHPTVSTHIHHPNILHPHRMNAPSTPPSHPLHSYPLLHATNTPACWPCCLVSIDRRCADGRVHVRGEGET